ncbi:MAG: M28 family peptidase [Sphingomicrobium sp.]
MRPVLLLCALILALVGALAATPLLVQPPDLRATAKPGEFDATRAKARLGTILGNQQPHPADSFGDDAVRARLIGQIDAMGLHPIVRDQFACNEIYKQRGVTCARVKNVIVALGPTSGKALLLNAHYDSTPVGPAAADDGVGVATLLEIASILKNERLKRPLILLFNEGEELGLVGARAFMADPLSGRVDSLVNLEARGTTGPVTMFETSLPNGAPVRAFARAVDRPFANSLTTDFYRQLPNYTDVNSFSERGWLTLNFAMIGNETRYHSPGDDIASLDPRSLQHMGDQTLAVARELVAGAPAGGGTLLFADLAGRQLLFIPQALGFGLLAVLVLGFAGLSFTRGGMWRGLALVLAGIVVAALLAWIGTFLMGLARPGSFWRAYPLWTQIAVYGCAMVAAVGALGLIGRRLSVSQLRAGFWLAFLLLGVAVFFVAPGGVIYFLLPPLVALLGMVLGRWFGEAERAAALLAAALLWLTFGEVLALLGELMSNGPFFILAPLAFVIVLPWLIEAKALIDESRAGRALVTSAVVMLAGWAAVAAAPAYSADRQQRFVIQHATDTASGKAYWSVVNDRAPLPKGYGNVAGWRRDELPHVEGKRWIAPTATIANLKAPELEDVASSAHGNLRTVTFRIRPNGAESVTLVGDEDAQIVSAGSGAFVRPIAADTEGEYYLTCFGRSCDGAVMQFTTRSARPMVFTLVGSRRGLPATAGPLLRQRPRFARPQYSPDATITISQIAL